jgi:aspartate ammonia-lyase
MTMTTAQRFEPDFPSRPAISRRRWHALSIGLALAAALAPAPMRAQTPAPSQHVKPRVEKDLLGAKEIPGDAYYGVQTLRALENFKLSGIAINHYPGFVEAWAMVKLAAARANTEVGAMKPDRLAAIEKAAQAILAGKYHDQFKVDWYQGGAGTSTNMNANEVMANIGLELTGHKKGEYQFLEPHDDLNMSQSTNDSYPTAIKVAFLLRNDKLIEELQHLVASFRKKADAYIEVVKMGRTEMQDAVPMTVGQEFHAFASSLEGEIQNLREAEKSLYTVNMGATAIGTGINVPKGYPERVAVELAKLTGKAIVPAKDMLAATWDQQGFVIYSSALKSLAIKLSKISNDLILLTSGPRAGLAEINLPAIQPGSSIMPGKVNPVVPEVMNLVAFRVMGNDLVVTLAAHSGQLQLNAYEPVEGLAVIESQSLLFNTSKLFRTKCIDGITVNEKVLAHYMETTIGIVTALNPILGYEKATELAAEAAKSGKGILEVIREKRALTEQQIKELLDPVKLTGLDKSKYAKK